jgi:hypothetical protein
MAKEWVDFHNLYASLQLISREANQPPEKKLTRELDGSKYYPIKP